MSRGAWKSGSALAVLLMVGFALVSGAGGASARPQRALSAGRSVTSRAASLASVHSLQALHGTAPHHTLIPAKGQGALPRHAATVSSLNWSGYADLPAAGQQVTSVTGNWVVPAVQPAPPGFSAMWTGIGGYNTSDLIQAGTSQDTLPIAGPQYFAWYEILPAAETQIFGCTGDANCTVAPGDSMSVSIVNQGGNSWTISMANNGKWTYSKSLTYNSTKSSAEWILEAPTLVAQTLLANVGTTTFDPGNSFALNGASQTIAQGNPVAIDLGVGPANEAIPSSLDSDGDGFNDCAYALSCSPPAS